MESDSVQPKKITKGIVGFFDILGYKNIIRNNDIENVTNIISGTIKQMPDKLKAGLIERFDGPEKEKLKELYIDPISVRLISDSILISLHIDEDSYISTDSLKRLWLLFLFYSSSLCREMFNVGLPIRGAIDFGQYYVDEQCFAGEPIVNCYELSEQMEMSGVVLTPEAYNEYIKIIGSKEHSFAKVGTEYLVPLKNGVEKKMYMLDWYAFDDNKTIDIRQEVYKSFKGNNKDVPVNVILKIQNTEFAIRSLQVNHNNKKINK